MTFETLEDLTILSTACTQFIENQSVVDIEERGERAETIRARHMLDQIDAAILTVVDGGTHVFAEPAPCAICESPLPDVPQMRIAIADERDDHAWKGVVCPTCYASVIVRLFRIRRPSK